jgi:hypothetical protein
MAGLRGYMILRVIPLNSGSRKAAIRPPQTSWSLVRTTAQARKSASGF